MLARLARRHSVFGLLVVATVAGCSLNPQPLPPGEQPDGGGQNAFAGDGAAGGSVDGGADATIALGSDGAATDSAPGPADDGSADAATDAPTDAPAATDAPGDVLEEGGG